MSLMIGPRIGKYDEDGNPRPIFGHHVPMMMFGTFILAFGWFGFNAGSSLSGMTDRIGLIAVNTMLASGSATVAACFFMWKIYGKPDPSMMCNGMLGGLVAITAPCAFISPVAAFFIGIDRRPDHRLERSVLERKGIDDPVGAISVHGVGGLWGILSAGPFRRRNLRRWIQPYVAGNVTGLFYGDAFPQSTGRPDHRRRFLHRMERHRRRAGVFLLVGRFSAPIACGRKWKSPASISRKWAPPGYPEFVSPRFAGTDRPLPISPASAPRTISIDPRPVRLKSPEICLAA